VLAVGIIGAQQQPPAQPAPPQQPSSIATVITGDSGSAPHYAVPDFIALTPNAAQIAQMLGQVLWDDLNFEREFDMIPRDVYKSVPVARSAEQVPFAAWREVGADGVFFGTVEQTGNDVRVSVRLFKVNTRTQVFGQEYTIAARSARRIAHEVADTVHKEQSGELGLARTRIAFVSDRTR
jgi:TolB protein